MSNYCQLCEDGVMKSWDGEWHWLDGAGDIICDNPGPPYDVCPGCWNGTEECYGAPCPNKEIL